MIAQLGLAHERRVRASRLAGRSTIPTQIRDIDDQAARQVQIIENLQREGIAQVTDAEADKNAVLALSTLHFHADKSDRKQILAQSWRRAEGDDTCKYAQAGVTVLGEGRGTRCICIEKKKWARHWQLPRAKATEARRKQQVVAEQLARERREAEERAREEQKFYGAISSRRSAGS